MKTTGTTIKGVSFSPRETDCVELLKKGLSIKQIARELTISPRTVELHVASMREKTETFSKTALMQWLLDA